MFSVSRSGKCSLDFVIFFCCLFVCWPSMAVFLCNGTGRVWLRIHAVSRLLCLNHAFIKRRFLRMFGFFANYKGNGPSCHLVIRLFL